MKRSINASSLMAIVFLPLAITTFGTSLAHSAHERDSFHQKQPATVTPPSKANRLASLSHCPRKTEKCEPGKQVKQVAKRPGHTPSTTVLASKQGGVPLRGGAKPLPELPPKMVVADAVVQAKTLPTQLTLTTGRGHVLRLPNPATRVAVGNPEVVDFNTLSGTELLLLGKSSGGTNLLIWNAAGKAHAIELSVTPDLEPLKRAIRAALPQERGIELEAVSASIMLRGVVSDTIASETARELAQAHLQSLSRQDNIRQPSQNQSATESGQTTNSVNTPTGVGRQAKVINLLKIRDPQQVMLEVRIAEVSKTLLEGLGIDYQGSGKRGSFGWTMITDLVGTATGASAAKLGLSRGNQSLALEAKKNDNLIKILAEPTIVAMSGQEGSFLVGGKIYIPVPQGLGTTTLEERTYGVGLKFVPTVLDGGRISLKVAPEVSEPSTESVMAGNATGVAAFKTSNVSTTVQMREGESLVIGGLLRDKVIETINAVPALGEIPILGALFRSNEFIADRSELVVMVKPTLVKGTLAKPPLPTDGFVTPKSSEFFLKGKMEGASKATKERP